MLILLSQSNELTHIKTTYCLFFYFISFYFNFVVVFSIPVFLLYLYIHLFLWRLVSICIIIIIYKFLSRYILLSTKSKIFKTFIYLFVSLRFFLPLFWDDYPKTIFNFFYA